MILEKFSSQSNGYVQITVTDDLVVEAKGTLEDEFDTIAAVLNPVQDLYESRIGVILAEPGSFRFSFDFLTLYPNSVGDRIGLLISHSFTIYPSLWIIEFSVEQIYFPFRFFSLNILHLATCQISQEYFS